MVPLRNPDDPRRRLLVKLLSAGAFSTMNVVRALAAEILGERPGKLPPDRSIYRLSGQVTVNGAQATLSTRIGPTDTIVTGRRSEIVFVVGDNAYILRESSTLNLGQAEGNVLTNALRLFTGKLLAVFPQGRAHRLHTVTATIGIRGTGVYLEADPEQTYFCTCYGTTDIRAANDPQSSKTVQSKHHDEPVYILARAAQGKSIRRAPFINHTDQELMLIETLVGRQPPFVFPSEDYGGVRKPYE